MSGYSELIKNFERVRGYMREFYIYGFKSRGDYDKKSGRSYDEERRHMESWLGEHMGFVRSAEGKNVFISVDSRISARNTFYRALKTRSFTDGDITLHFLLFDILHSPDVSLSLSEVTEEIDRRLSAFEKPMVFDESTVRKKLREYVEQQLVICEKQGRKMLYRRSGESVPQGRKDAIRFFSEAAPCGVIGSFILDRGEEEESCVFFKHHYIGSAMDSQVLAALFDAISRKSAVTVDNLSRKAGEERRIRIVPLRVFISAQNGRQHILAYQPEYNLIKAFRIDYLSRVKIEEPTPRFDELRAELDSMQSKMWGVTCRRSRKESERLEKIELKLSVGRGEEHIARRLQREKRCGAVEKLSEDTWSFSAEIFDAGELVPWLRSFICRIKEIKFSNVAAEKRFRDDLEEMYRIYGIEEVEG